MKRSHRLSVASAFVLGACIVSLLAPILARAGTAQMDHSQPGMAHLSFTAAGGETNHLYLLWAPGGYRLIDLGAALTAGPGCSSVSANEVLCAFALSDESPTIDILLGDQNDFASVAGTFSNETTVDGEGGADELELSAGCEINFDGECDDILLGGPDNDVLRADFAFFMDGGPGGDSMAGGIVDYSGRVDPVTVDPDGVADDGEIGEGDNVDSTVFGALGGSAGDTFTEISALGGGGNDTFTAGGDNGHFFLGQAGDDICAGSEIFDDCEGGPGDDQLSGGGGGDDLFGGGGADTIRGGHGRDFIIADSGSDVIVGGPGRDFMSGGPGDDTLRARDGFRDRVLGGRGFDRARTDRTLDVVRRIEERF